MAFKTITTWDHEQAEEQLVLSRAKAETMADAGLTDGVVTVTSKSGDFLTVKEREWATAEAATEWTTFVLALPNPPVSSVVITL